MRPPRLRQAFVALALALASPLALALSCEELRATVNAKIRDKGVKDFSVAVVDAGAALDARIVGSCELGTKKLVYTQGPAQAASQPAHAAAAGARAAKPAPPVLTECADGRVITQGGCRK